MTNRLLPLEKREVLRYLGYKRGQALSGDIEAIVEEMLVEVQKVSNPRYLYQLFDIEADEKAQVIRVLGTDLVLTGKDIWRHLHQASQVALLACTLGLEVEQVIRRYEITDLTRGLVLDCACTEYIEKICDLAECEIAATVAKEKVGAASARTLNQRFSPGYGDLPLAIQPAFIRTVAADTKLGITLSKEHLMIPRKSVTALIGLFANEADAKPRRKGKFCQIADFRAYHFRIGGAYHD